MQRHGDRSLGRGGSFFSLKGVIWPRTRSKTMCLSEERVIITLYGKSSMEQ